MRYHECARGRLDGKRRCTEDQKDLLCLVLIGLSLTSPSRSSMLRYRQLGVLGLLCLQFSPHVSTSLAPTVPSDKASEAFYRLSQPSPTQTSIPHCSCPALSVAPARHGRHHSLCISDRRRCDSTFTLSFEATTYLILLRSIRTAHPTVIS